MLSIAIESFSTKDLKEQRDSLQAIKLRLAEIQHETDPNDAIVVEAINNLTTRLDQTRQAIEDSESSPNVEQQIQQLESEIATISSNDDPEQNVRKIREIYIIVRNLQDQTSDPAIQQQLKDATDKLEKLKESTEHKMESDRFKERTHEIEATLARSRELYGIGDSDVELLEAEPKIETSLNELKVGFYSTFLDKI